MLKLINNIKNKINKNQKYKKNLKFFLYIIYYIVYYIFYYNNIIFLCNKKKFLNDDFISVIIPSHKSAMFLEEAILSVLNQTYKNFEIIIMTDKDDNKAFNIVKKINNKKISFFCDKNKIYTDKFNFMISKAKYEILVFLSEDDLLDKNFLKNCLYYLNKKKVDIVYTTTSIFFKEKKDGWVDLNYTNFLKVNMKTMFDLNLVSNTAMFRKKVWEKHNYKHSLEQYNIKNINNLSDNFIIEKVNYSSGIFWDWDLWFFSCKNKFKFYYLKQNLFFSRKHLFQDSIIAEKNDLFPILKKNTQYVFKNINN